MSRAETRLVTQVLGAYRIRALEVVDCPSSNNRVFRVVAIDGRDLIVRLHRPGGRTRFEVTSEVRLLEAIATAGSVTAPIPLRTVEGDATTTVTRKGTPVICTVLSWLPGTVLRPGRGAGPQTVRRIGQAIGRLHGITTELPADPGASDITAPALVRQYLRFVGDPEHVALIEDVLELATEVFATSTERALIHHDVVFSNCLHVGARTAIIDFDDCGVAPLLQDLGGMLENIADSPRSRALRSAFLEGSASVRPIPARNDADLDSMIAVRHAWATAWTYMRGAAEDFTPERVAAIADTRMTSTRRILQEL